MKEGPSDLHVTKIIFSLFLQAVITLINHAIGASGVVSEECKTIVAEYGQTIIDLLLANVSTICILLICSCLLGIFWLISFIPVVMSGMLERFDHLVY